ncbi:MAG: hypothetical protein JWM95_5443 [Gemmatimonadetes bacterium]|nr:hypothetical protein [Gemmatimonadota bacterium]
MTRNIRIIILGGAAMLSAACAEKISSTSGLTSLDAAFISTPLGFESTSSSFSGEGSSGTAFMPGGDHGGQRGPNGLMGGHDFMGGGFGPDFLGGPLGGGGRPFDRGGLPSACTFSSATGIVTCPAETHDGLTITQTAIFKTAANAAQAAFDSLTNSVTKHVAVSGTQTRRDNAVTTVNHVSDQTVTGLASTATQRTVNGTSKGTETSTGTDTLGTFTAARAIGDTTTGVIIPITSGKPTYPTAGTVIRSMTVTVTYTGKSPTTRARREVVTYDGTATAKLVVTQDGTTKTCTIPLPHGRPTCT